MEFNLKNRQKPLNFGHSSCLTHSIKNLQLPGELLCKSFSIGDGIFTGLHHALDILLLTGAQLLVFIQSVFITPGNALTLTTRHRL